MDTATIGDALRKHRKDQHLSMYKLGLELHIGEMSVFRHEKGQLQISPSLLVDWALLLKAPEILVAACNGCPIAKAIGSKQIPPSAA